MGSDRDRQDLGLVRSSGIEAEFPESDLHRITKVGSM